jgi:hypothetical protein
VWRAPKHPTADAQSAQSGGNEPPPPYYDSDHPAGREPDIGGSRVNVLDEVAHLKAELGLDRPPPEIPDLDEGDEAAAGDPCDPFGLSRAVLDVLAVGDHDTDDA